MLKLGWQLLAISLWLTISACSSGGSEQEQKVDSCEQVKEFDDIYQECLKDANK